MRNWKEFKIFIYDKKEQELTNNARNEPSKMTIDLYSVFAYRPADAIDDSVKPDKFNHTMIYYGYDDSCIIDISYGDFKTMMDEHKKIILQ